MSSGLLYLAIVGVWAGVLVPMWVRRSDSGDARGAEPADVAFVPRGQGRARARVVARRRRRLSGIVALFLVTVVIAATGVAPWWIVPVPGAALVGYLACLRAAALYDAELLERDRARAERMAREYETGVREQAAADAGAPEGEQRSAPGLVRDEEDSAQASEPAAYEAATRDPRVIDFPTASTRRAARDEPFDQYADPPRRAVGD